MKKEGLKRICVFCGSTTGDNPVYAEAARVLGEALAVEGLGLVYGGGQNGLMGILATAVTRNGGYVIGVIPSSLATAENAYYEADEYIEVDSFHERKILMSRLADAFFVLPGGPGTLEELIEQLAWSILGLHEKPTYLINTNGFWDPLITLLSRVHCYPNEEDYKFGLIVVDEPVKAVAIAASFLKPNL